MPPRPKKICSWYGCHELVKTGSRCEQHRIPSFAGVQGKGNTTERGYGASWRRLREQILKRDNYLCHCPECLGGLIRLRPANEVDHIIPKSDSRSTDDPENLRAINEDCHKKLTAAQAAAARRS